MRSFLAILLVVIAAGGVRAQEIYDDFSTPERNAVAALGGCTATLIAPDVMLSVAHCTPRNRDLPDGTHADCKGLEQQDGLAGHPLARESDWTELPPDANGYRPDIRFGPVKSDPLLTVPIVAYAVPHCADIGLMRLARPVPPDVAVPLPAITQPPGDPEAMLAVARLLHAGYGATLLFPRGKAWRQTGRVGFWSMNRCHIFALPPERAPGGPRILHGDSGSPLIVDTGNGRRVAGVLFGAGVPDHAICGLPTLPPPRIEGTYTPTFRGPVPGTQATDLGQWIAKMVAEAQ